MLCVGLLQRYCARRLALSAFTEQIENPANKEMLVAFFY